ncbi:HGGxSTG domain-containing protein, partial [Planctomycetota bacterium]
LKNGNPQGNPNNAPRCGAMNRRGTPCMAPAMKNGRCRLHGGKSTGPRTPEGLERSRRANLRHGFYCAEMLAERREVRALLRSCQKTLQEIGGPVAGYGG